MAHNDHQLPTVRLGDFLNAGHTPRSEIYVALPLRDGVLALTFKTKASPNYVYLLYAKTKKELRVY